MRIDARGDGGLTKEHISRALARPSSDAGGVHWFADFGDVDESLERRIDAATGFLVANRDRLAELADRTVVSLDVAFTPQGHQDGLAISAELASELARLNACTRIDVYLD